MQKIKMRNRQMHFLPSPPPPPLSTTQSESYWPLRVKQLKAAPTGRLVLPTVQLIIVLNCTASLFIIKTVRRSHLLLSSGTVNREKMKKGAIRTTVKGGKNVT